MQESKCVHGNAITFNYAYWHFEHFKSYFPFLINTLSIFKGFGYFDWGIMIPLIILIISKLRAVERAKKNIK